jgi:hypothetical protein
MSTPSLQALLQFTGLKAAPFPINSRYRGIDTATLQTAAGLTIVYLRRRFIPSPVQLGQVQEHTVKQGERLDNLAAQFLGDPELFWRLSDSSGAMRPEELEVPGSTLRIAVQLGLSQNA